MQYDLNTSGTKSNTITLSGGDGARPVAIQNVAAGVNATDAANVGQLNNLASYTSGQVARLDKRIDQVAGEARTGTALALAAAALRYDDRPGKTAVAGAAGVYRGKYGLAFGAGHTSEDGRWRYNLAVSFAPATIKKDIGASIGASYTFD